MELNLHDGPRGATISNVGVEFHNPSWWFWVKAGMGFTLGAGIVTIVSVMLYWLLLVNIFIGLMRLASH